MRYLFAAALLSCSPVSSAPQKTPTSAGAVLSPVSAPASLTSAPAACVLPGPETDLASVAGWGGLYLEMPSDDAMFALKAAKIDYQIEVSHGYFSAPPGAELAAVSHSVDKSWRFSCAGWSGAIKLNTALTTVSSISVESPFFASEAEAKGLFEAFEKSLGAPYSKEAHTYPGVTRVDHCWKNQRLTICILLIQSMRAEASVWQIVKRYSAL